MRRWIPWVIFIFCITYCTYSILLPKEVSQDVPKEIATLPLFNLLLTDSQTVINTKDIKSKKATVFFYFDPNCEHCQKETEDIIENKDILSKTHFYFISLDSIRKIKEFMQYYQLQSLPGITVASDYEFSSLNIFKIKSIPSSIVYNSRNQIVAIFEGRMTVAKLREVLNI